VFSDLHHVFQVFGATNVGIAPGEYGVAVRILGLLNTFTQMLIDQLGDPGLSQLLHDEIYSAVWIDTFG
jgi:hypothetical protein